MPRRLDAARAALAEGKSIHAAALAAGISVGSAAALRKVMAGGSAVLSPSWRTPSCYATAKKL